ncbi:MAG: outer membrane beta-barrel family protein [Algibacter sp.]
MKRLFFLCTLLLSISIHANTKTTHTNADKNGSISGKVLDAKSNQPLPYVNIIIKDTDNKTLTGGITLDDGTFKIDKIAEGKVSVHIQYIGYKTYIKQITIGSGSYNINLGDIKLEESTEDLDAVLVIAETSSVVQKIDRKIINVGKDLTSAGTTASEMLNNIQSVNVDSQTGNISLRGNENVRVLIDGKPSSISTAQLLKQIPSSSIKQIELITNPSAKYNPEGMSGMINIILHKNANQGFNGSVNTGLTRGINTRFNGSIDMNYKTGKVNFFTNYGYNTGQSDNKGKINRFDNNSAQRFLFNEDNESHLLKFGADVYINDKNTLSAYTVQNRFDGFNTSSVKISEDDLLVVDSYAEVDNERDNETYNFHYKLEFDKKGEALEFEANYSKAKAPEYTTNEDLENPLDALDNESTFNNYIIDLVNVRKTTLLNLDYTNPISENSKLELGLEYRTNKAENDSDSSQGEFFPDGNDFIIRDTPDIAFTYDRDIYSAYANYNQKFNKIALQVGARLEQYEIEGIFNKGTETIKVTDDIFTIYPSAFLTFNPSEKNQFQLSYSRRVDRPSIEQVNPIRQWSTPRITNVGNPDLRPQFTNSFEFNYTRQIEKGSFSFGTFYRRVSDNISRIVNVDPLNEDNVLLSFENYESSNRYGVEASASYKFAKWWNTNASTDLYLQKETGIANGDQLEVTNNVFNVRINNNFTASKNLRFQLFYMFQGGGKGIQFETRAMSMLNLGTSLNVLKSKGTISFRVNDIFRGMRFKFDAVNPYPAEGQFNWESRTAYLGFNYRFGGGKNKALRRKNRDNNEAGGNGGFL